MAEQTGERHGISIREDAQAAAKAIYLGTYGGTLDHAQASRAAGVDPRTVRRWLADDVDFAEAQAEARAAAIARLEAVGFERATRGTPRVKFNPRTGQPYLVADPEGRTMDDPSGATVPDPQGRQARYPDGTVGPLMVPRQVPLLVPYVEYEVSDTIWLAMMRANDPRYVDRKEVKHEFDALSDAELVREAASLLGGAEAAGLGAG